jgi:hypothetical protein
MTAQSLVSQGAKAPSPKKWMEEIETRSWAFAFYII